MIFNRIWAMPGSETLNIKPIKELVERYVPKKGKGWIDFFARNQRICEITNDINPIFKTSFNKCALSLSTQLRENFYKGAILDMPFSMNQNKILYENFGRGHYCTRPDSMVYWAQFKNNVAKIIQPGGTVITCAWSSMGLGKNRGFQLNEILLVPHGGSRNDTIVTVETKIIS